MRIIIQRVSEAVCVVENSVVGKIGQGLVAFVGLHIDDTETDCDKLALKIANARVFEDEYGKMNKSVRDIGGSILSISQFTLYGDTRKGNRPSFDTAARPEIAKSLYEYFNHQLKLLVPIQTGVFQADMKITAVNDGPVTLMYESKKEDL